MKEKKKSRMLKRVETQVKERESLRNSKGLFGLDMTQFS